LISMSRRKKSHRNFSGREWLGRIKTWAQKGTGDVLKLSSGKGGEEVKGAVKSLILGRGAAK